MAKAYKTNYKDPGGKTQTGYIIEGKTYKDPEGKERIEHGSTVETLDGYYTLTSMGGQKRESAQSEKDRLSGEISNMKKNSERAYNKRFNAQKEEINRQKQSVNSAYMRNAQQEYLRSMESKRNINQILKAQGINGGMSESAVLANQLSHENALNDLKLQRDSQFSDLDSKLLELRAEADYNIAMDNSKYDQLYLDEYSKLLDRQNSNMIKDIELAANNYHKNRDYDRHVYEDDRDYERGVFTSDRDYSEDVRQFDETQKFNREKEANENQRFYDNLSFQKEKSDRDYDLDVKKFNHTVANDNRNYNLKASKKSSSGSKGSKSSKDDSYARKLNDAKVQASFGNYKGYQDLYGWSDEMREQAERQFIRQSKR